MNKTTSTSFSDNFFINLKNMFIKNYIDPDEFKEIIIKYKELDNLTSWKNEHIDILAEICEMSQCYVILHRNSYDYYARQENLYIYPMTIINGLVSLLTLIGVTYPEYIDPKILAVISGGVNLLSGIITGIYKKFNYGSLVESHKYSSEKYNVLYRDISYQLKLSPDDREQMPKYLQEKFKEYDDLITQCPRVPDFVLREFSRKFKDMHSKKPMEVNGLERVVVYQPPEEEIVGDMLIKKNRYPPKINSEILELVNKYPKFMEHFKENIDLKENIDNLKDNTKKEITQVIDNIKSDLELQPINDSKSEESENKVSVNGEEFNKFEFP